MEKGLKRHIRHLTVLLLFFALAGIIVGLAAGLMEAGRNGYFGRGMFEILFWIVAKSLNHNLKIFVTIAAGSGLILTLTALARVPTVSTISRLIMPFSILAIFYFYGRAFLPVYASNPGRLAGKLDVEIFVIASLILLLFFALWTLWLRKRVYAKWSAILSRTLLRPVVMLVICLIPAAMNLADLWAWNRPDKSALNLVIISIDTLRADHLGCYGYEKRISPNIDKFCSESVRFGRAISQSSWTLPAHGSLFTGLYPSVHGGYSNRRSVSPSHLMLAEILRNAGYATAGFTGGGYLDPVFGFGQGFMAYRFLSALDAETVWDFVDGQRDRPFFLFLHTYKVHNYYVPPEMMDMLGGEYVDEFPDLASIMSFVDGHLFEDLDDESEKIMEHLRDRYDISILNIDGEFASLLKGLDERGLTEKTLIVFLSDHGEEFGEHGRTYHGGTLYNDQIHVPLIMRGPGIQPGEEIDDVVELLDVYPTVLEYLGLPIPVDISGKSLVPRIEGRGGGLDGLAFSGISSHITEKYSVCSDSMKLIFEPSVEDLPLPGNGMLEAYDLSWGPGWKETPAEVERSGLAVPFQEWYTGMKRQRERGAESGEIAIDPALEDELRALGYVQ